MTELDQLLENRKRLDEEIANKIAAEKNQVVREIQEKIQKYNLLATDLFIASVKRKPVAKIAPKYKDPTTGETWTGRGKPPTWIEGKDRAAFAIK